MINHILHLNQSQSRGEISPKTTSPNTFLRTFSYIFDRARSVGLLSSEPVLPGILWASRLEACLVSLSTQCVDNLTMLMKFVYCRSDGREVRRGRGGVRRGVRDGVRRRLHGVERVAGRAARAAAAGQAALPHLRALLHWYDTNFDPIASTLMMS